MKQPFSLFKKIRFGKVVLRIILMIAVLIICVYGFSFLLGPPELQNEQNTIYYSHNDEVIGKESGLENRNYISLDEISSNITEATIAVEDKNFYNHRGFDMKRIIGAIVVNIRSLSLKEGASTLTQQYARNLYLSHEKTWSRKLREAFYTIRLEMFYSKDEILEGYLNTIYFGHGAYGIEAASQYFFNKSAKNVSLAEAAMLAGIPKGPTYYSPLNDEQRAKKRQEKILGLLLDQEKISENMYADAMQEELIYAEQTEENKQVIGAYFQDMVLKEVSHILDLDYESIKSGGYEIYTTLDIDLQLKLEEKIVQTIKAESKIEIGAIAMDPDTGGIQALVGGRSYDISPFNRAVNAKRMPGSTFKPILYYTALANNYTASTSLLSKPTTFVLENDEVYAPSNFNDYYANEPITLAQAIALSDNIYAVKTNLYLGTDKLIDTARKLGIKSDLPEVPSLALGTASVSVNEMVTAYSRLANGKQKVNGHTVEKIVDRHGKQVFQLQEAPSHSNIDEATAFILTDLMTGMFDKTLNDYMTVTGSGIADQLTRPYAGKSGSTKSDSWMIGYSPTLVTGIWTGYDDNRAIENANETTYAKKVWASFMEAAHENQEVESFKEPQGVVGVPIDPTSGQVATPYCPTSRVMYFKANTEPTTFCSHHFPEDEQIEVPVEEDEKGFFQKLFELFR